MNLPNALTIMRLLLVPAFAWLYLNGEAWLALATYLLAALTDALDGYLARRLGQVTRVGKLLDPAADKLMQLTMMTCLASTGHVPWWALIVLFVKELYLVAGSLLLMKRKIVIQANIIGKAATLVGVAAVICLFPWHPYEAVVKAGQALLLALLALSLCSVVSYTIGASRALKRGPEST